MNKKKINIVFVGRPSFPIGGAMTKRHRYYIDYLSSLYNVRVCNINTWNENSNNPHTGLYKDVVKYYNTSYPKKISSFLSISRWGTKLLKEHYCKDCDNIAIFCTFFTIEQILIMQKAKKLGYKIVCDIVENYNVKGHDMSKQMKLSFYINKLFLYKKVDAFIVISNQLKNVYRKYGKPILMLTNSAPIKDIVQKENFNSPMRIVYTGTYANKDGLSYLIKGFCKFIQNEGNVAELLLIGKGKGDDLTEKEIKNNTQIKKLGFVTDEDLIEIQQSADLLCMTRCNSPFANYGFPFKLSEYMATGNPVLATAVGDVPLYIKDKKNGLLIEPSNSEAIFNAIEYAYKHPNDCIKMGNNAVNTIKEHFDVEKNGQILFKFIKNIFDYDN